jgi:hypothetical protein
MWGQAELVGKVPGGTGSWVCGGAQTIGSTLAFTRCEHLRTRGVRNWYARSSPHRHTPSLHCIPFALLRAHTPWLHAHALAQAARSRHACVHACGPRCTAALLHYCMLLLHAACMPPLCPQRQPTFFGLAGLLHASLARSAGASLLRLRLRSSEGPISSRATRGTCAGGGQAQGSQQPGLLVLRMSCAHIMPVPMLAAGTQ